MCLFFSAPLLYYFSVYKDHIYNIALFSVTSLSRCTPYICLSCYFPLLRFFYFWVSLFSSSLLLLLPISFPLLPSSILVGTFLSFSVWHLTTHLHFLPAFTPPLFLHTLSFCLCLHAPYFLSLCLPTLILLLPLSPQCVICVTCLCGTHTILFCTHMCFARFYDFCCAFQGQDVLTFPATALHTSLPLFLMLTCLSSLLLLFCLLHLSHIHLLSVLHLSTLLWFTHL